MEELGWNWFPVLELDLSIQPNGHAGFAMEQQFHFQTMHFKLGHQGINRVPGAGNWDMESQSIITAIGSTYATIMFSLVCVISLSHLLLLFETLHVMTGNSVMSFCLYDHVCTPLHQPIISSAFPLFETLHVMTG